MMERLRELLSGRIALLDGGLGTMIQRAGVAPDDYRGRLLIDHPVEVAGCNDVLVLTAPEVIEHIHGDYLRAGSDVITTDTFGANALSLGRYGLETYAYEINYRAAALARRLADDFTARNPHKPRFVGGSVGPTGVSLSMGAEGVDFERMAAAYTTQIMGLVDGGADLLLLETFFDSLNAKAAIRAAEEVFAGRGVRLPVIVSGTLTESGRTLAGQTVEAFYASVRHAAPLAVSLNCSFGAEALLPHLRRLEAVAETAVAVYPNAGLPDAMGSYAQSADEFAGQVEEYLRESLVNLVGGCCGTTPLHIAALAERVGRYAPRPLPDGRRCSVYAGLETLDPDAVAGWVPVGERANVAGSARFRRLIREERFDEAVAVARDEVEAGARMVDVCMDDGMIDAPAAMTRFLMLAGADPALARVPFMLDSSQWEVLEAGLRCVQGKPVVNSISLKEGEAEFLRRAEAVRRYGAAAVVMLFDERGQADTYERKIEVARRAWELLAGTGFPAEDIIFDPNVLAVATGIAGHEAYGRDFIEACRWIKRNLPGARVSAGVSNLSFAFRGHDRVRRAMHAVFLRHAAEAGLDMALVNPAELEWRSDDAELMTLAEAAVLGTSPGAADALAAYAARTGEKGTAAPVAAAVPRESERTTPAERVAAALEAGRDTGLEGDLRLLCTELKGPSEVIAEVLLPAMERVGERFGAGQLFLPQVVRSARAMQRAIEVLTPYFEQDGRERPDGKKILIATVKGDVHDIGKNIVAVVMSCGGYRIRDLGVMVEAARIADETIAWGADAVGLSGLITPSLAEMAAVAEEFARRGLQVPILIGGAATSDLHTAVRIAPHYAGPVIRSRDAADNTRILSRLFGPDREEYLTEVRESQRRLRERWERRGDEKPLRRLADARAHRHVKRPDEVTVPRRTGSVVIRNYPVGRVRPLIDWNFFFPAWEIKGHYPELLDDPVKGEAARRLLTDAEAWLDRIEREKLLRLDAVAGIFPAVGRGDDIVVRTPAGERVLAMLRNQQEGVSENLSLADYVLSEEAGTDDYVGLFALSGGIGLETLAAGLRERGDQYGAMMVKLLADRLTEALAEALHGYLRRELWGYETGPELSSADTVAGRYRGLRMAFGYPASPDHSLKRDVFDLLDVERHTPLRINDNYMIVPGEALCGLVLADASLRYFSVGRIDDEQLADYARRRGLASETLDRIIAQHR